MAVSIPAPADDCSVGLTPQVMCTLALTAENYPVGGVTSPYSSQPQQAIEPSVLIPQLRPPLVLTEENFPLGSVAWPPLFTSSAGSSIGVGTGVTISDESAVTSEVLSSPLQATENITSTKNNGEMLAKHSLTKRPHFLCHPGLPCHQT